MALICSEAKSWKVAWEISFSRLYILDGNVFFYREGFLSLLFALNWKTLLVLASSKQQCCLMRVLNWWSAMTLQLNVVYCCCCSRSHSWHKYMLYLLYNYKRTPVSACKKYSTFFHPFSLIMFFFILWFFCFLFSFCFFNKKKRVFYCWTIFHECERKKRPLKIKIPKRV